MPSIKDLKKRIVSVKNTQQTTKAMKMVSAAKLRRSQEAIVNHRPYSQKVSGLLKELLDILDESLLSSLATRFFTTSEEAKKVHLVLVTSDRGLCGAFNSSVIRLVGRTVAQLEAEGKQVSISFIGRRGADFYKKRNFGSGKNLGELGSKPTFRQAKEIAEYLIQVFVKGEAQQVIFIYNEFKNAAVQKPTAEILLPLAGKNALDDLQKTKETKMNAGAIFRPAASDILNAILEKYFSGMVYRILLESAAGEHGARMAAMENATKNAGEMIRKLTLQYNKQRQAGITKELLEIISGSESQKSA